MKQACVIGDPIGHSKSPLIHGYWLEKYGIEGAYEKRHVKPENLKDFVKQAWDEGLKGFNATIPHKEALMDLVAPDAIARAIGAINTVYMGPKGWIGTNTDGVGWWASLGLTQPPKRALVLGAGGAARAIIHTLKHQGVRVSISNRTRAKAEAFGLPLADWQGHEWDARGYDLIVNTSACGMNGVNPLTLTALDPGTVVSDLVYQPHETEFLASAKALGGRPVYGIDMLLHQAAGGFEKWFGVRPEITDELRAVVLAP